VTDPTAEKINAAGDFITKLTGSRIALAFVMSLLAITAYSIFENRVEVFHTVLGSIPIMISIGVGAGLSIIGWLFSLAVSKIDETQKRIEQAQLERIIFLEGNAMEDHRKLFEHIDVLIKQIQNIEGN
jgi:hypothetical protein